MYRGICVWEKYFFFRRLRFEKHSVSYKTRYLSTFIKQRLHPCYHPDRIDAEM